MKVKVIQLAIVPVFALSACTDDDPNRKAMPTQQSQAQVVRHDDGSYSRPTTPATAQVVDSQQLKTGRISANQANSQPCQNPSSTPQPQQQGMAQQQPCETTSSGGGSGGGGGGGSSTSTYNSGGNSDTLADNQRHSTTRMGFASRVSPDVIDSRRNVMVKSRGGFGASGGFGRAGG